jgi:hypothetical protein
MFIFSFAEEFDTIFHDGSLTKNEFNFLPGWIVPRRRFIHHPLRQGELWKLPLAFSQSRDACIFIFGICRGKCVYFLCTPVVSYQEDCGQKGGKMCGCKGKNDQHAHLLEKPDYLSVEHELNNSTTENLKISLHFIILD